MYSNAHRIVTLGALVFGALIQFSAFASQTQYDSGDPTADEQYVLEVINRARANPTAEGQRLGININAGLPNGETATPKPPLAMNKILLGTALAQSADMYNRKFFDHTNPDGLDPFQRMTAAGYNWTAAGENIAASTSSTAAQLEDLLMIDAGEPGVGHRVNLLNTDPQIQYREIGIGYYAGATIETVTSSGGNFQARDFLTQDFGMTTTGPFVLGVVYADANSNNFYDPGEGLAGVTITPDSGSYFAVTGTAGGYAFPIGTSGTLKLTASGGALTAPITMQVTLTGFNVKVDFNVNATPATPPTITSSLTANGSQYTSFTYGITATGTQPITFGATGLPTGLTLSGSTISGTPTQSGQFMVTLTAHNSGGTDTETLVLTIAAPVSNTLTDTDGDGFPDELEIALGTSPTNPNSTPFGGVHAVPQALTVTKLLIKLNFAKSNLDSVALTGKLPVPAGFIALGKTVTVDIGGVIRSFVLSKTGTSVTPGVATFHLPLRKVKGAVAAQTATFTMTLSKGAFAALLTDEGLENATYSGPVSIPAIVLFNQEYFNATVAKTFTAKKNVSGATK